MNTSLHLCRWYAQDGVLWELRAEAEGTDDINITIKGNGLKFVAKIQGRPTNITTVQKIQKREPLRTFPIFDFRLLLRRTRTALFRVIMQWAVIIHYRRFGTTYRSHLRGGCPETSVNNYHFSLHNSPEKRSSRFPFCLLLFSLHSEKPILVTYVPTCMHEWMTE
jgi:hypothetical protein